MQLNQTLTPALSLWERERESYAPSRSKSERFGEFRKRLSSFPLPLGGGEGQGEGEADSVLSAVCEVRRGAPLTLTLSPPRGEGNQNRRVVDSKIISLCPPF